MQVTNKLQTIEQTEQAGRLDILGSPSYYHYSNGRFCSYIHNQYCKR